MTPKDLLDESLPFVEWFTNIPFEWNRIECIDEHEFKWTINESVIRNNPPFNGCDWGSIISASEWLKNPVSVQVTKEHYNVLSQVEVRLHLRDVQMPYRSMCVWLPKGMMHKAVLLHRYSDKVLIGTSYSYDNKDDVTTLVRDHEDEMVESSLSKFDETVGDAGKPTHHGLRVAINVLMCMMDRGFRTEYLRPKDIESDQRLAKENTPRGERARSRLKSAVRVCRFEKEERLHVGHTGATVACHWRRGHWAMQPYGPANTLRKRIYRAPQIINADKGEPENQKYVV
jgi:hypothetical protein